MSNTPFTVSSVACSSDSKILIVLKAVEAVICSQRYRVDDEFPMFSGDRTWQGFVTIWVPVGLSSGLSP